MGAADAHPHAPGPDAPRGAVNTSFCARAVLELEEARQLAVLHHVGVGRLATSRAQATKPGLRAPWLGGHRTAPPRGTSPTPAGRRRRSSAARLAFEVVGELLDRLGEVDARARVQPPWIVRSARRCATAAGTRAARRRRSRWWVERSGPSTQRLRCESITPLGPGGARGVDQRGEFVRARATRPAGRPRRRRSRHRARGTPPTSPPAGRATFGPRMKHHALHRGDALAHLVDLVPASRARFSTSTTAASAWRTM